MTAPPEISALCAALLLVTACGSDRGRAAITTPSPPTPSGATSHPTPQTPPSDAPAIDPSAPMPSTSTHSFPLVAGAHSRTRGSVTITVQAGSALVTVAVAGLPPGSAHSVHLHFGSCPGTGSHVAALGTLRADAAGDGTLVASVSPPSTGPGHFVIVYEGPATGAINACADIG